MVTTCSELISLWPTAEALAERLRQVTARSITGEMVRKWKARGRIPAEYWADLVTIGEADGIEGVTLEVLARLARQEQAA